MIGNVFIINDLFFLNLKPVNFNPEEGELQDQLSDGWRPSDNGALGLSRKQVCPVVLLKRNRYINP